MVTDLGLQAYLLQNKVPLHIFVYALSYVLRRKHCEVLLYVITTAAYTMKHTSHEDNQS